jgi:hypothetical protein
MEWKIKKYHSFGTVPKSNIKIVERGKTDMTNTQIHDCWLQENSGKVKLTKINDLSTASWTWIAFSRQSWEKNDATFPKHQFLAQSNGLPSTTIIISVYKSKLIWLIHKYTTADFKKIVARLN